MSRFPRVISKWLGLGPAVLLTASMLGSAPPATALVTVGELDTPDLAIDIELVGNLAYIADLTTATTNQGGSLRIVDVSDPLLPVEIGVAESPDAPRAIQVVGGLAYIADGAAGLRIIDVSEPTAPQDVSLTALGDIAYGVEVDGALAYLSMGPAAGAADGGFRVVDVSNPAQPVVIGSLSLPGEFARDAEAVGGYVFVATAASSGTAGKFHVIDVRNPWQPTVVRSLSLPYWALDVEVSDNRAYVAISRRGLAIIDVSNPTAPVQRGTISSRGFTRGVTVADGRVYLAELGHDAGISDSAGLRVIDASNPAQPVEIGAMLMPEHAAPDFRDGAYQVEIAGDLAFVSNGREGLRVVDLTHRREPVVSSQIWVYDVSDLELAGDMAYVPTGESGVRIYATSDPTAPNLVSVFDTLGTSLSLAKGVAVAEPYLYVAVASQVTTIGQPIGFTGIRVVDIANPTSPVEVGSVALPSLAISHASLSVFEVAGDLLVAGDLFGTIQLIDVSRPADPVVRGTIMLPSGARDLKVEGDTLFVAAGTEGFRIFDVSQPAAPIEIAAVEGRADDLAIDTDHGIAFVTDGTDPLGESVRVIDVSDPIHPEVIATWAGTQRWASLVEFASGLLFRRTREGVRVYDVMDPIAPRELGGAYVVSGCPTTLEVKDGVAWLGSGTCGIYTAQFGAEYTFFGDTDEDGLRDPEDNCSEAANSDQLDVNRDGFGNACDADYDDNGMVGMVDFARLARSFDSRVGEARFDWATDANGDGAIGMPDWSVLGASFGKPPGPSGLACAGSAPCEAP